MHRKASWLATHTVSMPISSWTFRSTLWSQVDMSISMRLEPLTLLKLHHWLQTQLETSGRGLLQHGYTQNWIPLWLMMKRRTKALPSQWSLWKQWEDISHLHCLNLSQNQWELNAHEHQRPWICTQSPRLPHSRFSNIPGHHLHANDAAPEKGDQQTETRITSKLWMKK